MKSIKPELHCRRRRWQQGLARPPYCKREQFDPTKQSTAAANEITACRNGRRLIIGCRLSSLEMISSLACGGVIINKWMDLGGGGGSGSIERDRQSCDGSRSIHSILISFFLLSSPVLAAAAATTAAVETRRRRSKNID